LKDELGDYFKEREKELRFSLDKNKITIIRLDGMRFHNFTKPFLAPYDPFFHYCMDVTLHRVIKAELGNFWSAIYRQSDEASIVMLNVVNERSELPFGGRIEKIASALLKWNTKFYQELLWKYRHIRQFMNDFGFDCFNDIFQQIDSIQMRKDKKHINLQSYITNVGYALQTHSPSFDCRFIQLKDPQEITDYFTWRRKDAIRNWKNMLGRQFISHKKMHGLSANEVIEKVEEISELKYVNFPTIMKRGNIYRNLKNYPECIKDGFRRDDDTTIEFKKYVHDTIELPKIKNFFNPYQYNKKTG
jgi:tRNA(His) 5'-end guanylyltransferase